VDIGVHVKGRILDSAFTLAFDHTYDKLLEAVEDATNTGVRVRILSDLIFYDGHPKLNIVRKPGLTFVWVK